MVDKYWQSVFAEAKKAFGNGEKSGRLAGDYFYPPIHTNGGTSLVRPTNDISCYLQLIAEKCKVVNGHGTAYQSIAHQEIRAHKFVLST